MKHKRNIRNQFFIGFALVTSLTACTAHFDGGDAPPVKPDRFGGKPRVAGPAVEGQWASPCVRYGARGSRKLSMNFAGESFQRVSEVYSDPLCQRLADKEDYKGQYIFSENYADGATEISYAIDLGSGVTSFTAEKILLENDALYVSDFVSGSTATVNRNFPMRKAVPQGDCENYDGSYQMNSTNFTLQQTACQQITWLNNSRAQTATYVLDGVERDYNGTYMKASIENRLFKLEYRTNGRNIVEKYSFQTAPCHLSNPTGRLYLTKDVWIDGQPDADSCDFYAKYR